MILDSVAAWIALLTVLTLAACGDRSSDPKASRLAKTPADSNAVNLFIWSDFMAPQAISSFEKTSGVRVRVAYFDSNDVMEARLMTGSSGFDVVMTSATAFKRQIDAGVYLPLDKSRLPNLQQLDPELLAKTAQIDPDGRFGAAYAWGTLGILYNPNLTAKLLPDTQWNSWQLLFNPLYAAKLSRCGISFIDDAAAVVKLVLIYLGKDPDAPSAADYAAVEATLMGIRPHIRTIDTGTILDVMANGDSCVALDYSSDAWLIRKRTAEARNGVAIRYVLPQEGSLIWMNWLAIPRDAPNPANAHRFINHLLDAQISASFTNLLGSANGNLASIALLDPATRTDTMVYPSSQERRRLLVESGNSPQRARTITRIWQRFKTGAL